MLKDCEPRWLLVNGKRRALFFKLPVGTFSFSCTVLDTPMTNREQCQMMSDNGLASDMIAAMHCSKKDCSWNVTGGTSFDDLSLSPSINIEGYWHKTIKAGQFV